MNLKSINEKDSISFARDLLDYYSQIDNGSINKILTSDDIESQRNNAGWYQHIKDEHKIFVNIPNILCLKYAVEKKEIDVNTYYAFLTLCISHEFRHFMQGRCIWEGKEIDGYGQNDVLNAQLMLYVRYFFDAYYLLNKGYVKYEEDAEKFAVKNGTEFLKNKFPGIDVEKSMVNAVNYYAKLQSSSGAVSTLPKNCRSIDEILFKINDRISKNLRINDLTKTLFVYNLRYYGNHGYFGLDEDKLLNEELIENYSKIKDGSKKDLLVVKSILELLDKKEESLEEFPILKKNYLNKKL